MWTALARVVLALGPRDLGKIGFFLLALAAVIAGVILMLPILLLMLPFTLLAGASSPGAPSPEQVYYDAAQAVVQQANTANDAAGKPHVAIDWHVLAAIDGVIFATARSEGPPPPTTVTHEHAEQLARLFVDERAETIQICPPGAEQSPSQCRKETVHYYVQRDLPTVLADLGLADKRQQVEDVAANAHSLPPPDDWQPEPAPGWVWPVPGHTRITSMPDWRANPVTGALEQHPGVDIAVPAGTPVLAAHDGTVTQAGPAGECGVAVAVRVSPDLSYRYCHLSAVTVQAGQTVHAGDVVGESGSTGESTGPHLHLEVREDGDIANPLAYYGQ